MNDKLYTWDDLYERADDKGYGSQELTAKDEARYELRNMIMESQGYDIEQCECPEEEIDCFLNTRVQEYLFDENGNFVCLRKKNKDELVKPFIPKSPIRCKRCGKPVAFSLVEGYSYQCFAEDEDLFSIEVYTGEPYSKEEVHMLKEQIMDYLNLADV